MGILFETNLFLLIYETDKKYLCYITLPSPFHVLFVLVVLALFAHVFPLQFPFLSVFPFPFGFFFPPLFLDAFHLFCNVLPFLCALFLSLLHVLPLFPDAFLPFYNVLLSLLFLFLYVFSFLLRFLDVSLLFYGVLIFLDVLFLFPMHALPLFHSLNAPSFLSLSGYVSPLRFLYVFHAFCPYVYAWKSGDVSFRSYDRS